MRVSNRQKRAQSEIPLPEFLFWLCLLATISVVGVVYAVRDFVSLLPR
jgi:hypothetical protein